MTLSRPVVGAQGGRNVAHGIGLQVRAVHTGECEFINGKIGGIAVVTSSRICGVAGPSQVLVSDTVRDLVAGAKFEFSDQGIHQLKGVPERQLFSVALAAL
jgi:class 3 adenylate cyclase